MDTVKDYILARGEYNLTHSHYENPNRFMVDDTVHIDIDKRVTLLCKNDVCASKEVGATYLWNTLSLHPAEYDLNESLRIYTYEDRRDQYHTGNELTIFDWHRRTTPKTIEDLKNLDWKIEFIYESAEFKTDSATLIAKHPKNPKYVYLIREIYLDFLTPVKQKNDFSNMVITNFDNLF